MSANYAQIRQQRLDDIHQQLASCSLTQPFVLEVGCGHGHFLTAYAEAHPGRTCIGVDQHQERIGRALRKRNRAALPGLHFIRAEVSLFLEALPAGAVIADVFILFPDPWPKLRHHKHRIMQPAFLRALRQRVGESGRLMFRTDHAEYFAETHATLAAEPGWQLVDEAWPFEFETIFQQRAPSHQSLIARPRPSVRLPAAELPDSRESGKTRTSQELTVART